MGNQQDGDGLIPIPFISQYYTDGNGNIYSTKRKKLKKMTCWEHLGKSKNPYLRLRAVKKLYLAHRLIASVHVNRELHKDECVNHKNGNTKDNRLCNLSVVSHKENVKHAVENGLYSSGEKWYAARSSSTTSRKTYTQAGGNAQLLKKRG